MTLELIALPENEAFVRTVIAAFAVECDPTVDTLNDIKTAISEAVTNCVVHAYPGEEKGLITIHAFIEGSTLSISITDYGKGIENVDKALQDFYTTKQEEERSGLGFTIMKSFMDELHVTSTYGAGTTVKMIKNISCNADR